MKKNIILLGFVLMILLAASVFGINPYTQTSDSTNGLVVEIPQYSFLEQNVSFNLHTHVFNSTTGLIVFNDTTNCYSNLYDNAGNHIVDEKMSFDTTSSKFNLLINGENFSQQGEYRYLIYCNSTSEGGFVAGNFWVTKTGKLLDDSGFPPILAVILPLLFVIFLWTFAFKLDSKLQPFKMFFTGVGFALLFLPLQSLLIILQDFPQLLPVITTLVYVYGWIFWGIMVFIVLNFVISILEWIKGMKGGTN